MLIRDLHPDPNLEVVPHLQRWLAGRLDPPILKSTKVYVHAGDVVGPKPRVQSPAARAKVLAALRESWQRVTPISVHVRLHKETTRRILMALTDAGLAEWTTQITPGSRPVHFWRTKQA